MKQDLIEIPLYDESFIAVHWPQLLATFLFVMTCGIALWLRRRRRNGDIGS